MAWKFFPVIGLLVFFALAVGTAVANSPTVDESVHVLRGRTLWQTGVMELQYEHGPLSHWLIGLFLPTELTLSDVTDLPSWDTFDRLALADELLWQHRPPPNIDRVFFLARLPIIFLGLLTGSVLARWACELWGKGGQLIVLPLFVFSPNLLASFSLATTDGALTAVFLASIFTWWRYWKRPSLWYWTLTAIVLGLALATKMTALLLLPLILLLSVAWRPARQPGWFPIAGWLAMLPLSGLVVWALYGFELKPIFNWPVSIPAATYFTSLFELLTHVNIGHTAFLLGERSTNGWWYY